MPTTLLISIQNIAHICTAYTKYIAWSPFLTNIATPKIEHYCQTALLVLQNKFQKNGGSVLICNVVVIIILWQKHWLKYRKSAGFIFQLKQCCLTVSFQPRSINCPSGATLNAFVFSTKQRVCFIKWIDSEQIFWKQILEIRILQKLWF